MAKHITIEGVGLTISTIVNLELEHKVMAYLIITD
jgi:hypothetical protein